MNEKKEELEQAKVDPTSEDAGHPKETWTTEELKEEFEVLGFQAPFVVVVRRADGVRGSLQFDHHPRLYYAWESE